jgi:hypothetical protein
MMWWPGLLNDELEGMCNEAVMAWFEVQSRDLNIGPEEKHKTISVRISGLSARIWRTRDFPNTKQETKHLTAMFGGMKDSYSNRDS